MSVLDDFQADGVVYLELRTTPRNIPRAKITRSRYIEILLRAITAFEKNHKDDPNSLHTRLILSIDRRHSRLEALEIASLAAQLRLDIVGLDLSGDPAAKINGEISVLDDAVAIATNAGLKLAVHFAESEDAGSDVELRHLLGWRPARLGHVIHCSPEIKAEIATHEGIGLELCLSCNVKAGMVTGGFEGHHFGEWWKLKGPLITLGVSTPFGGLGVHEGGEC